MASIFNRSPFVVRVAGKPKFDKQFPLNARPRADAYASELVARGLQPRIEQLEISFQVRVTGGGRTKPTLKTFDSREAAEAFVKVADGDRARGLYVEYTAAHRVSFKELIEAYVDGPMKRKRSYDVTRLRLGRIVREHEDLVCQPFGALLPEHFNAYVDERLDDDIAPATVDRELDDLRAIVNWAISSRRLHVPVSPWVGVIRPKYYNQRDRRLRPGEEERLLAAAAEDENPFVLPVIVLAIHTAMRRGEILALRSEWIDEERRCALLPAEATKSAYPRAVPLTEAAMQILHAQPHRDGTIFPVSANAIRKAFFERVVVRAGIADLHFHDLRHEALSRYAEAGRFTLLDLAQISGHRDLRMLQRYTHLCTRILAERMDEVQPPRSTNEYLHKGRVRTVVRLLPPSRVGTNARGAR